MDNRKKLAPMTLLLWALMVGAALLILLDVFDSSRKQRHLSTGFVMDTVVEQQWYGRGGEAMSKNAMALLEELEGELSLFRGGSAVARLEAEAGKGKVALSHESFELLERGVAFSRDSAGRFDITIAPVTTAWGVTSGNPRIPPQDELDKLLSLVDWRDVLLDPVTLEAGLAREGQGIDLGGLVKGYACDRLRDLAREKGIAGGFAKVGSSVLVVGRKPGNELFRFGIQDPKGTTGQTVGTLVMGESGNGEYVFDVFSTSGDYERFFVQEDKSYHHIFDPATGYPADTDLTAVVVVSTDGLLTDYLSTTLFVGGTQWLPDRGIAEYGYIAISKDNNVYISDNLRDSFWLKNDYYTVVS